MTSPFRHAWRQLGRTPAFIATAVATLALCIGANLAIFAVLDAVLLHPLPFPASERLVTIYKSYPRGGVERAYNSILNYSERRSAVRAFAAVSAHEEGSATVGQRGSPRRVPIARVSPEFFSVLGIRLAMGRSFSEAELSFGRDAVAVLTDEFWRAEFSADPKVLGRQFQSDGHAITVVGVLPAGFRFLSTPARFYRPLSHAPGDREPGQRHSNRCSLYARLAPGATVADAQAQIDVLDFQEVGRDELFRRLGFHSTVAQLHRDYVRSVRPLLVALQCGCLFLLLIGLVNLANLLLIRASSRSRELAIRQSLGAGRRHVATMILAETILLALSGGLLGIGVGCAGVGLLRQFGAADLPQSVATIQIGPGTSILTLAAALVVGVALAIPIIWHSVRAAAWHGLQNEAHGSTAGPAAQRLRHAFVVVQISLAFVLLSGAGLLALSVQRLLRAPLGFSPDHVLTGHIELPWKTYHDDSIRLAFVERLQAELNALPGVTAAAIHTGMPFAGEANDTGVVPEGYEPATRGPLRAHFLGGTAGDYWRTLGIPVLQGRKLDGADNRGTRRVCVVDQAVADRYWPGGNALGRRLCIGVEFHEARAFTVVGVVGSTKQADPAEPGGHGAVYFPYPQFALFGFSVAVRTPLSPEAIGPVLAAAVVRLDPELPVDRVATMNSSVSQTLATRRSSALLAALFAGAALVLAGLGTYGVLTYAVSHRRREIGVRMAVGALPRQIVAHFVGLGCRLLTAGLLLGLIGGYFTGRALQSLVFGVPPLHPGVLTGVAALLVVIVLCAVVLPARRAARTNPVEILRAE